MHKIYPCQNPATLNLPNSNQSNNLISTENGKNCDVIVARHGQCFLFLVKRHWHCIIDLNQFPLWLPPSFGLWSVIVPEIYSRHFYFSSIFLSLVYFHIWYFLNSWSLGRSWKFQQMKRLRIDFWYDTILPFCWWDKNALICRWLRNV